VQSLRTPDERFESLDGYEFSPNYSEVADGEGGSLRIHHLDEGPTGGETLLCLHGQPTWSYLYRHMLPVFVEAGCRVVAPDFVGFGRSDKPTERGDYSYARHVDWMSAWLEQLDLRDLTLFCQDWGGLIGLRLVARHPDRFARVVTANTALPDGQGVPAEAAGPMRKLYESLPVVDVSELGERFAATDGPPGFLYWRKFCAETPDLRIADIMRHAGGRDLPASVLAGYDAPFPGPEYQAGARQFPSLVPVFPDDPAIADNQAAWELLRCFDRPFLTAFSDGDPVTRGAHVRFQEEVAGAKGQQHVTIRGAGHFLQEDAGPEVAAEVLRFIEANPLPR
jgi:haloalkane dehalogenase